jgi:hypothetical protein
MKIENKVWIIKKHQKLKILILDSWTTRIWIVLINKIIPTTTLFNMISKNRITNLIKMHINWATNSLKISKILNMIFQIANIIKNLFSYKFKINKTNLNKIMHLQVFHDKTVNAYWIII